MSIETPQQVADKLATTLLLGRPVDDLTSFRGRVAAMTGADLESVVRAYIDPQKILIVVVGDARQLLEKLRVLADTVDIYDVNDRPISAESLVALPGSG